MARTISVVIPNYNRAAIVGETIENMLRQSLSPLELIVVDDGSTDNSVDVIRSFGSSIKLITQENQGPGVARNNGIKVAKGDFIQLMDSDDLASRNKLEIQLKVAESTGADMVYGPWAKVYFEGTKVKLVDTVLQQRQLPAEKSPLKWFLTDWSTVLQCCLLRKNLLLKLNGYRNDMWGFEDSELTFRMLLNNAKIVHESQTLTLYRQDDFGKLTSSGVANEYRALNKADYVLSVLSHMSTDERVRNIVSSNKCMFNIWMTLKDLKNTNSLDSEQYKALLPYFTSTKWLYTIRKAYVDKLNGVKARFLGHRWHYSYQTGKLTADQKKLIRELGFVIND